MQTDHIDPYQLHGDDPDTPLEETLAAFGELIKAGKAHAIGPSNCTARRLAEAVATSARLGLPRYESVQPLYNLYDWAVFEKDLQALSV